MSATRKRKAAASASSSSAAVVATNTGALPSIEELERLGIEPAASLIASFDVKSDTIVFRSLLTFTVLHTVTCADSAASTVSTPAASTGAAAAAPAKRRAGRTPAGAGAADGDQRVVLPAMAKVSLSTTVSGDVDKDLRGVDFWNRPLRRDFCFLFFFAFLVFVCR